MPIAIPTLQELTQRIYSRISSETGLIAGLESTAIGVVVKVIAAELLQAYEQLDQFDRKAVLSSAAGVDLDTWGFYVGLPRRIAQSATTLGQAAAVRFTNIGGVTVNIPQGTRVFKETEPQIAFFTTAGATLPAGSSVDLHVTASQMGDVYNVGVGELTSHSVPNAALTVTNILPIVNGSNQESDASYRERILQEFRRRNVLNPDNTVAMIRRIPIVKDVYLLDLNRGAGTFDVIVIPHTYADSNTAVSQAQQLLNENVPAGISALAKPPQYRQLDVAVRVRFSPQSGGREETVRESIRAQIKSRIDNLPIEDGSGNGTFFTGIIESIAQLADPIVLDATVSLGLDGSPISDDGEIRLSIGERLLLRALAVE